MTKEERFSYHRGYLKLLEIKESDMRILTLQQCREAVDKGLHAGGAFSAMIPLVALYYGGFMDIDPEQPTRPGQDMFVLSKGHAIAAMASIYADLGYYPHDVLHNSRSLESILNGHPGPILPGVHISTGPLGQGIAVAQGFAIQGKNNPHFNVFCMTGDGELQEGLVWEAVMYASHKKLDNFCVVVDKNNGQLDIHDRLIYPLENLGGKFESFGWNVHETDATKFDGITEALASFRESGRNGKPTVIICNSSKGHGSFNNFLNKHKVVIPDEMNDIEESFQKSQRDERAKELLDIIDENSRFEWGLKVNKDLRELAVRMNLELRTGSPGTIFPIKKPVLCRRASVRDKKIKYKDSNLPVLDITREYAASDINKLVLKEFAKDPRIVSIDADLASTSGLESGVGAVDQQRGLNVGVAEANMMNIGEAYAVTGHLAFVSTFCPFFDWKVMRRIAVGHQERIEDIESGTGWLNDGHGLDLTFVATAPNFETKTNGATHMGNDDIMFFDAMAHLKIIDVSCPQLQISILKWIAEGNKGLVYMRIMRSGSGVLHSPDLSFQFGKGYFLDQPEGSKVCIISSGRGVHEAVTVASLLKERNVPVTVADMPSIDEEMLVSCVESGQLVVVPEQNNGYIWSKLCRLLVRKGVRADYANLLAINTLDKNNNPQFIHSGTYGELTNHFGLSAEKIADKILKKLG